MKLNYTSLVLFFFAIVSLDEAMENHKENIALNTPPHQGSKMSSEESDEPVSDVVSALDQLSFAQVEPGQDEKGKKLTDFGSLKYQVQNCLDNGDIPSLHNIFNQFLKDDTQDEKFYKQECLNHNITKWPSQATFREAYFGEILYPGKEMGLFYEHSSNAYLLQRFDILWSLAMSSRFNNPLALYYLTRGLKKHLDDIADCKENITGKLYRKAFETFEKTESNKDAYFLRAIDCEDSRFGYSGFDVKKAFHYHELSNTQESHLRMLMIRSKYIGFEKPKLEDYLDLTKSYPKAYVESTKFADSFEEKQKFLTLSGRDGYVPSLLELGLLYNQNSENETAWRYFEDYGNKGHSVGYLYCSFLLIGNVSFESDYRQFPSEKLIEATSYLEKAQNLHNPQASYQLGIVCLEMLKRTQAAEKQEWQKKAEYAFNKAFNLGEMGACQYLNLNTRDPFENLEIKINEILGLIQYDQ